MCTNWKQYRFKTQLHIGFSLFNFVVLAAIFIAVFTFTYVITAKSESHLRDRLAKASEGYTSAIAADSSAVFDQLLDRVAKNFLNIIAFTAAEYKLTSTVFKPQPSFYEWVDTLAQPAAYNPRYNSTVSFEDGGYSVAHRAASDRYSFSSTLNNSIDLTQPSMVRMKTLFELNSNFFIGGYWCLGSEAVLGTQHIFREYPAASNGNKAQLLAYDCAQDDWYASGVEAVNYASSANYFGIQRAATYTSAYIDPWIHQAMITIAMPLFDPVNNDFLGVAGADLLTTSIQASIEGIRYLAHGRAVLFEVSSSNPTVGVVIADTARSISTQQTKLQYYPTLRNPSIDPASWAAMFQPDYSGTLPALPTFVEVDDAGTKWWVASKGLKQGSGAYMLSIMVLQSDVNSVLDPVLSSISSARKQAIIVVCIVCGVVLLLAALVTLILARRIVDPISKLTLDSQRIIDRIGHSNMLKSGGSAGGAEGAVADSSISETRQLQQAHRKMIENIEAAQREQNAAAAAQQVAGKIDYALPAFDPAGNFDQNFVPGASNNASALPSGILLDASSLPASPALPVGVLLHFDPADQLHPPQQQSQTQQQGIQLVNMSPYGVSASTSLPASASHPYNNNTPISPFAPRQSQPYGTSTAEGQEGKQNY